MLDNLVTDDNNSQSESGLHNLNKTINSLKKRDLRLNTYDACHHGFF